nr:transposase family protein [Parafrankia elaeagni]
MAERHFPDWHRAQGRPRGLDLVGALRLALCRLRRNATYQELAEDFGIGISTAWTYHQIMVTFLSDALGTTTEALSRQVKGLVCLIDGTLIPTFAWHHRDDLLSGKHRRHGVNVQLAVDLHGRLLGASRAFPGSWHDVHCFREAGWTRVVHRSGGCLTDLGYEGEPTLHTPLKKKPGTPLPGWQKQLNTAFASVRVAAEWGVAHTKNWRILTTRHRSELGRIDADVQAAVGLQKINEQQSERILSFERIKRVSE